MQWLPGECEVHRVSVRGSRRWQGVLVVLVAAVAVSAGLGMQFPGGGAPVTGASNPADAGLGRGRMDGEIPFGTREMQEHQLKKLREEHQKQVFSDTTRMLALAAALKADADKGAKPTPDTLKDVDEIAKLAKRVSERIKTQ
jgi:hypothetical protein